MYLPHLKPAVRTRSGCDSQDGVPQQQEDAPLFIPQFDRHHEAFVRIEDDSNTVVIPSQHRVTQQIIARLQTFKDLKQTFAVSRRAEQLQCTRSSEL